MGKWADGQMGRWADGQMGKLTDLDLNDWQKRNPYFISKNKN